MGTIWSECRHDEGLVCRNCPAEVAHRARLQRQADLYTWSQNRLDAAVRRQQVVRVLWPYFAIPTALAVVYGVYVVLALALGVAGVE